MKIQRVLIIYKKSAYRIYFLDRQGIAAKSNEIYQSEKERFKLAHQDHYESLKAVVEIVQKTGLKFDQMNRGQKVDFDQYDCIISVGGDGTFLEAARSVKEQLLIGVNSAPRYSVGRFCCCHASQFGPLFDRLLQGQIKGEHYHRLRVTDLNNDQSYDVLNDVLIAHRNPATMSRYYLTLSGHKEEQRSSGVWVATPAGSSAALMSAGGYEMQENEGFQYRPRELYNFHGGQYQHIGGVLRSRQKLKMISLMRQGVMYFDGAHHQTPFPYANEIQITLSPKKLYTLKKGVLA